MSIIIIRFIIIIMVMIIIKKPEASGFRPEAWGLRAEG